MFISRTRWWRRGAGLSFAFWLCLAPGISLRAATFTWARLAAGNASGSWNQPTNWTGGTLPTTTSDTANFSALDITADSTVTLDGNREIESLVFGDSNTGTAAGWLIQPGSPSSADWIWLSLSFSSLGIPPF